MSTETLSADDLAIITELRRNWRVEINDAIQPLQTQLNAVMHRSSRLPGSTSLPDATGNPRAAISLAMGDGLENNINFTEWLKAPQTKMSHFETRAKFSVTTKAAPILNTGLAGIYSLPVLGPPQPSLRLGQVLPRIPVDAGSAISFTREKSFVPGADFVPESQLKPATALTFENITVAFETLATISKASLQSISDTPALSSWIQQRLSYSVLLREEQYLLNAPVNGLVALATPLAPEFTPAAGATQLDVIGSAISQLESAGYSVDAIVLNAVDANKTKLLKDLQNRYLWASPDSPVGTSAMWAVPVILSPSLAAGTFIVAALGQSAILFERETLVLSIAFQNEDDFVKNLCCFRAEERCALAVALPQGVVGGVLPAGSTTQATHGTFTGSPLKK